jgi:anti-sigma factor RsiW
MKCEQMLLYLHPYLDDELGVAEAIRFEEHLAGCEDCQKARKQSLALRSALRGADLYYRPSQVLAARVNAAIRQASKTSSEAHRFTSWQFMAMAAAILLAIGLATLFVLRNERRPEPEFLARAVVDSHIRSLQANHLVDMPSSDRHTVKPWFQGKLDFSPPVPDFSAQGWPLEGGRLDYIDARPVAALVYERRKHQINVFLWPAGDSGDEPMAQQSAQGYQVIHWTRARMTYWVCSDLNASELMEFAQLLRGK